MIGSNYTSASTSTLAINEAITIDNLMEAVNNIQKIIPPSIDIKKSSLAAKKVSVKIHKQGKHQSNFYHWRIQKKWDKRYGIKYEPLIIEVNNEFIGGNGKTLFVHPSIYDKLKREFANE